MEKNTLLLFGLIMSYDKNQNTCSDFLIGVISAASESSEFEEIFHRSTCELVQF